jgi:hypothetical protein
MRKSVKLMAAAALALGFAAAPHTKAALTNGGFETGDYTGWNTLGDASIQTLGTGFNPPQGNDVAFLNNDPSGSNTYDGTAATTNVGALDSFSGLAAGTLEGDGVTSGTAISQTFSTSGGALSFEFNFLTNEPGAAGNQDFAYVTLSGPGIAGTEIFQIANPTTPAGTAPPLTTAQSGIYSYLDGGTGTETGYLPYTIAGLTSGTYTVAFGVTNVTDNNGSSGLLIDSVTAPSNGNGGGGGGGAVPLPAAALLAPAALALAGRYTVKLRKQA